MADEVEDQILSKLWPSFDPDPQNVKYIVRQSFGLSVKEDAIRARDPMWMGECEMESDDEFTLTGTIYIRPNMPADALVKVLVHELAEYLAAKQTPHLLDGLQEEGFRLLHSGIDSPLDFRHQVALEVESRFIQTFQLDKLPPADAQRILIEAYKATAHQWLAAHPPPLELESVDMELVL